MNEDIFNMELRRFLKKVGVTAAGNRERGQSRNQSWELNRDREAQGADEA
jgi:Family of unknown function (DUF6494)